jgi:putative transposase
MPNYIRSRVPGATYFFTVTLADRRSRALVEHVDVLRKAYSTVHSAHPFETVAICVLPDHLHAIWRLPDDDADYSMRWQQIKRNFSAWAGLAGVWQPRFWEHQIRDDDDLGRHVDYVHWNPVKHGHVRQVRKWPHSSLHRWIARGDLPEEWGLVSAPDGSFGE